MVFGQYETKCEICEKKLKLFSGFENWAIMEHSTIKSLCSECSHNLKIYIKKLKGKN